MYRSLDMFTAIVVKIDTSFTEIWKKLWVGVFSEHNVYIFIGYKGIGRKYSAVFFVSQIVICESTMFCEKMGQK